MLIRQSVEIRNQEAKKIQNPIIFSKVRARLVSFTKCFRLENMRIGSESKNRIRELNTTSNDGPRSLVDYQTRSDNKNYDYLTLKRLNLTLKMENVSSEDLA